MPGSTNIVTATNSAAVAELDPAAGVGAASATGSRNLLDVAPSLPIYSLETIENLLRIKGVPKLSTDNLMLDQTGQYECYVYPAQALLPQVLLCDTINYFLAKNGGVKNRRVGFLLLSQAQRRIALIVELAEVDEQQVRQISQLLNENNFNQTAAILANTKLVELFRGIYKKVNCVVFGALASQQLAQQLAVPIKYAYLDQIRLNFFPTVDGNPSIVLVENIVSMLQQGMVREVVTQDAYKKHTQQSINYFMTMLDKLKLTDNVIYKDIQDSFIRIIKYRHITTARQERYGIQENTLSHLEAIMQHHQQFKRQVYQLEIKNLTELLSLFDVNTLSHFCRDILTPQVLATKLRDNCQQQTQDLKTWELKMLGQIAEQQQTWALFLWQKSKTVATFAYQHSLVQLGTELARSVADPLAIFLAESGWAQAGKHYTIQGLRSLVYYLTLSANLADRTATWLNDNLQATVQIPRLLMVMGALLGLAYSYALGLYPLLRMLFIGFTILQINQHYQPVLDDSTATVAERSNAPNLTYASRAISLALSFLETLYAGDSRYFLMALGGLLGSITTTELTKQALPDLHTRPGQALTKDQALALLLFSMCGQDFGYSLTNVGISIYDKISYKLMVQKAAIAQLQQAVTENKIADLQIKTSSLMLNPWLLFTAKNPLHIEWRNLNSNLFYQQECNVNGYYKPELVTELNCAEPIELPARIAL